MSFNYSTINSNGLPAMLPLLANLANGNHFLPTLAANHQAISAGLFAQHSAAQAPPPPPSSSQTALNETTLAAKLCQRVAAAAAVATGAGPMDLETLNDDRTESNSFLQSPSGSELSLASSANVRKLDQESPEKTPNFTQFNPCEMLYNMNVPTQNLMMMPGVMNLIRDASSSMMQTMRPQFSLMNQMPVQQSTAPIVSTANLSESSETLTTIAAGAVAATNATGVTASNSSSLTVAKETITCKSCTLQPPNPNAPPPSTRERPSGCRTVFVGGLPENCTEDIIREVFERCGEITTLRLSKKHFCHIRFGFEASVDSAIYLSGYRLRINNQSDAGNCGRLHVDYAHARDDQYEYECKQRQWQREQRHKERVERDRLRPQSPPIVYFSEHEATLLAERLKQEDQFSKAAHIFIGWLDRGDCNKKNSNIFYSMIQSTHSHVRRLLGEKCSYEEELTKAKELHRKHMQMLSTQLSQIERVFGAASHKKVWDHFSKAQRKNIDLWKKQSLEVYVPPESLESHDTDEMEMSEDEEIASQLRYGKRFRNDIKDAGDGKKSDVNMAYANCTRALDISANVKGQQLKVLNETIRNLQTQLLENKTKEKENLAKILDLEQRLKQANVKELLLKTRIVAARKGSCPSVSGRSSQSDASDKDVVCVDDDRDTELDQEIDAETRKSIDANNEGVVNQTQIDADEARLIALISSFLVIHPFGATLENILIYVNQISTQFHAKDIENVLQQYKCVFSEMVPPVGSGSTDDASDNSTTNTIIVPQQKWQFNGFGKRIASTIVIND